MLLPLRGVATLGHGRGKGSAGDKFRVIGMQETVEGAGANEVNGVLLEASCCRCGAPLIKRRGRPLFSRPLLLFSFRRNQNLKSRRQNGNIQNVPCFKPVTVKMSRPAVMPFEDDMPAGKAMDPAADVAVAGHKG